MSSKDTDNKSINQQLKTLFRMNKKSGGTIKPKTDFVLTEDFQRDLSRESPQPTRVRAIKELNEVLTSSKLEQSTIAKICGCIKDLFQTDQSTELRHLAFQCLQCLVTGQGKQLNLVRGHIFRVIKQSNPQHVTQRFDLFQSLTENGKTILDFEEEVGQFLLDWFPEITRAGKIQDYMLLLVNFIKYNATYIDEDVITGFVHHICQLSCNTNNQQIVLGCLQILDTIVAYYRTLPFDSLPQFIGALCRVANGKLYYETSWKIMRNLLGTHMGHSALFTMCRILQEPALIEDTILIRGAVFYINMALWGTKPLSNLRCPPSSVLPAILQAVQCNQPMVTYEVILGLQQLVNKFGIELQDPVWDILLQILSLIIKQIEADPQHSSFMHLHDTLTTIENLIESGNFNGNIKQFLEIIEDCAAQRPESSVMRLISYLSDSIVPTKHLWLGNLNNLLHRYYRFEKENRTNIRLKVLDVLTNVVQLNRLLYEDELVDRIVLPHMINLPLDNDYKIRSAGAKLLIDLCLGSESRRCFEMFDILEKLLNRPFELHANDNNPAFDSETADVKTVVSGLIQVFIVKIHKLPSMHAVKIYIMLVNHLELHYGKPKVFENCNYIRIKIFDCFLKMRADHLYRIGCPGPNGILKFSPYLCVTYRTNERGPLASPPPASPAIQQAPCTVTHVPMRAGFKIVIVCLKQEKDCDVLNGILQQLPLVLQNKSLILSKQGNNDIGLFLDTICNMVTEKPITETINPKTRADYFSAVLTVLPGLAHYHAYIDPVHQQRMIRLLCSFKFKLNPTCSRQCITALTTCTLEMQDVMRKLLPEVLLILSKSSATVHIAIPVLEFLSTLTILPSVFSCFVADQYMAVFAILLPYTNPFKYNHYTVSLAHHVIAVWFLKCRLSFRKEFVRFITNGLQANALGPFEETKILPADLSKLNQDSSDRKRSSSLTEQRSARRERTATVSRMDGIDFRPPPVDKTLIPFYEELTETCIDLMARYTFSPCSALPRRLPTAEFLLSGGQSMSWLLGNRVITVTTSGCAQKALKHGLCDKCFTMCKTEFTKTPEPNILRTSRSGSNDKEDSSRVTRQNSGSNNNTNPAGSPVEENKRLTDKLEQLPSKLQQLQASTDANKNEKQRCACWCQGWAEIYVRRPTGDMSWVMRIQNQTSHQHAIHDFPLNDISTLFMPSLSNAIENDAICQSFLKEEESNEEYNPTSVPISIPGSPNKQSPSRQSSRDSINDDLEYIYFEDGTKSRNPVRRSNSSPEMSANWKNPFLQQKQIDRDDARPQDEDNSKKGCGKNFGKDMRVSCEAIPEEIAGMGTTPPSCNTMQTPYTGQHPSLLSSLSYPGPVSITETTVVSKPYQTVPHSPNILTQSQNQSFQSTQTFQSQSSGYSSNKGSTSLLKTSKSESTESVSSEKSIERPTNLPSLNLMPLANKPPQSPTQTSPRMARHVIKDRDKRSGSIETVFSQTDPNFSTQKRDRGYTISVMSPARNKPRLENIRHATNRSKEIPKSGINPSFVFLQLYHAAQFGNTQDKPLLVNSNEIVQRALKVVDYIPPYETHRVGVIYIGQGQCNRETEILNNKYGSVRYNEFLRTLGTLIKLQEVDPQVFFLGGLDQNGGDGKFAYIWQDDVIRVMFHVATLMPNKESDLQCNQKKLHIGNNNVTIVYNESGEEYNINAIKGQFNFASVIIQPLDHNSNRVTVKAKDELLKLIGPSDPKIVSDQNVAILARQLALHANLASLVLNSLKKGNQDPYASNWLERLRKIKTLRNKILQDSKRDQNDDYSVKTRRGQMEDFTYYT